MIIVNITAVLLYLYIGAEKNIHGHRFRAQQDSSNGMSSIRAGSQNGTYCVYCIEHDK